VDPLVERAESVAIELGVKRWTASVEDVFHDTNIDAVIIATPTNTHAELIQRAARYKKHIFVEKPLTQDVQEADEAIQTIHENQVSCQVGFMRRFDPAYQEAKRRILAGDIGEPIYFKAISRDPGSPPPAFIKHSGGIFLDMSIHDYDMARYLMGAEVTSVAAHGKILVNSFMEEFNDVDQAITYLTFSTGAAGDVEGSRNAHYGYDIRAEVVGTEGTLFIGSLQHHDVHILNRKGCTHDLIPAFPERFKDAFYLEMVHFIDCLRKGEKPSVTEVDGKKALEIAVATKCAFETGKSVTLSDRVKV
jgi:scyllo-inositol 2-dehydrogenase (NAD+)